MRAAAAGRVQALLPALVAAVIVCPLLFQYGRCSVLVLRDQCLHRLYGPG